MKKKRRYVAILSAYVLFALTVNAAITAHSTLREWAEQVVAWPESESATFGGSTISMDFGAIKSNKIGIEALGNVVKDFLHTTSKGSAANPSNWLSEFPTILFDTKHFFTEDAGLLEADEFYFAQRVVIPPTSQIVVVGDLHGSLHSLMRNLLRLEKTGIISNEFKAKKDTYLIFTGDFVDRGRYSMEVLYTVLRLKNANPHQVFLLRGNHENRFNAEQYGFFDEITYKYPFDKTSMFKDLTDINIFFPVLLMVEIADTKPRRFIHFSHGGLSYDIEKARFVHSPAKLIAADKKVHEFVFEGMSKDEATGYMWSDFNQHKNMASTRGLPPSQGVGSFGPSFYGIYEKEIAGSEDKNILVGIFRGHQDQRFGLKIQNVEMLDEWGEPLRTDNCPAHWLRVVDKKLQASARTLGIPLRGRDYQPVFTLSSAAEGQRVPFDMYGVIKIAPALSDFCFEVHENELNRLGTRTFFNHIKDAALPEDDGINVIFSKDGPGSIKLSSEKSLE